MTRVSSPAMRASKSKSRTGTGAESQPRRAAQSLTGRIVSETETTLSVLTSPEDPTKIVHLQRKDIAQMQPSPVSLMPGDLLKPLNQDEVLDLLAYLLSRGNKGDPMFRK